MNFIIFMCKSFVQINSMPKSRKKSKQDDGFASVNASPSIPGTPSYMIDPDELDTEDIYPYILKAKDEFENIEKEGRDFNEVEIEAFKKYTDVVKKYLSYLDEEIRKLELNGGGEDEIAEIKNIVKELRGENKKNIARLSRLQQGRTEKERQLIQTKKELQDLQKSDD
ncbi:uncharacterized protein LOC123292092 [Chrysoperla carnea]|uniref:uncharacterized protein LOC123292092 n=1 Tax=Chrysoperla carnea TaxID=189513 RepID=UPI001D068961|nr:uncharacterized protein LOC123292092 [Chrysoperla carnea]